MRTIKKVHKAHYAPIADLITYPPLPSADLQQIDPFLFLNHHGLQIYPPHNNGLPFGPHPHRGMETVTFIIEGDIAHKDSGGNESVINAGGVQWMTAGKGLIHAEVSSDQFKKSGGKLEILQLWLNLPARLKMTEPFYKGLQKEDIPTMELDNGNIQMNLISGKWDNHDAAFHPPTDVHLSTIYFKTNGRLHLQIPQEHNIFFYIIRGSITVNGININELHLAEFNNDDEMLDITANTNSLLLLGHARPLNEPVVARGPFVMNSEEEIMAAYADFRTGKFGTWHD